MTQGHGGSIANYYNPGDIRPNGMRGGPNQANGGGRKMQDYQMQLMLLEHQNKKRLMMARQEQGSMTIPRGPEGPGGPGKGPNRQPFQGTSPQGSRSVNSPKGGMPSPVPEGQSRANKSAASYDATYPNLSSPKSHASSFRKRRMSGIALQRAQAQSIGSATDDEELQPALENLSEARSNARRLRRKDGERASLNFDDPPSKMDDLEEPEKFEDALEVEASADEEQGPSNNPPEYADFVEVDSEEEEEEDEGEGLEPDFEYDVEQPEAPIITAADLGSKASQSQASQGPVEATRVLPLPLPTPRTPTTPVNFNSFRNNQQNGAPQPTMNGQPAAAPVDARVPAPEPNFDRGDSVSQYYIISFYNLLTI